MDDFLLQPTVFEPERQSPKGLYKFQEEMRKIQLETSLETPCDTVSDVDMSLTEDTGYPRKTKTNQTHDIEDTTIIRRNANNNYAVSVGTQTHTSCTKPPIDHFAEEMLNDSDFDQMLLTCSDRIDDAVMGSQRASGSAMPSKSTESPPSVTAGKTSSSTTSSELNLLEDESIDDLLCNIDVDIPFINDANNSKFSRHKSMPQAQAKPATAKVTSARQEPTKQPSTHLQMNLNRKSFMRHESMPVTNTMMNRASNLTHVQASSSGNILFLLFLLRGLTQILLRKIHHF